MSNSLHFSRALAFISSLALRSARNLSMSRKEANRIANLSGLQQLILTVGSALGALVRPERQDLIATLGEVTGKNAARKLCNRMLLSGTGREILKSRRRISSSSLDMNYLSQLPPSSFGHQHFKFYQKHQITPDSRCSVQYIADEEYAYVIQRYRESHDFLHTLCGLSISVEAELALKCFEFIQTGLPMTIISSIFGPLALPSQARNYFYSQYLPWAIASGSRCNFYMNYALEEYLELEIEDVRRILNLLPFNKNLM